MLTRRFLPEVHQQIPAGMTTNETWMLRGRKAVPGVAPAAYYRPQDYVPEPFGSEYGIPLYRYGQTRAYHPRPETLAGQHYYDFFVASQNRHKLGQWDDGSRKGRPDVKPGWRTYEKYLSRAKVREHLRGGAIYGCWGNLWTNWFALDVNYHGTDPNFFLDLLYILKELGGFLPDVRWVYILNRNGISGLHLVGLLPKPRLLEEVRRDVRQVLAYLEDENLADLLRYKPENVKEDEFHPLASLEIYPAINHNFRLPYAVDRITVTDEWLNKPGEVNLKPNLIRFMGYVKAPNRQAVSLAEVIAYIKSL